MEIGGGGWRVKGVLVSDVVVSCVGLVLSTLCSVTLLRL